MPIMPETIVDPPLVQVPPFGLVPVAEKVHKIQLEKRWEAGFTFAPDGCSEASAWAAQCEIDDDREKPDPAANPTPVLFTPYEIVLPFRCSSYGWEEADYEARVRRIYDAVVNKAIEHEFLTGEMAGQQSLMADTPNDNFGILNPGGAASPTPVSIRYGVAMLTTALAQWPVGGTLGMIHLPAFAGERARQSGAIRDDDDDANQGMLRNARGDYVVIGSGYTGQGPSTDNTGGGGEAPQPNPVAGQQWIYATGLVDVRVSRPHTMPETLSEAFDRATNTVTFYAEGTAAAVHDGCRSFAVLVDLTL